MASKNIYTKATIDRLTGLISENYAKKSDLKTKVSELTNDSGFQTADQVQSAINAKIASAYKAGGSKAFSDLTADLLVAANEGAVYNVTDKITATTANFVEGLNKSYPAGTNVVVVNAGTAEAPSYKFDVLSGFVDLSGYVEKPTGTAGNIVKLTADGSYEDTGIAASAVLTSHQDITGKADKDTDAVEGNFASFDGNGNPVDSGHKHSDYLTAHQDISGKADKVTGATNGNLAGVDGNGNLTDSGIAAEDVILASDVSDYTEAELRTLLGLSAE